MITSSNVACPRDDRATHIFIWRTSVKEQSLTNLKQKGYLGTKRVFRYDL